MNIHTNMSTTPKNLVKISLVLSEISLLQGIIKKEKDDDERREQKVTSA